jgi:hypothetical protein
VNLSMRRQWAAFCFPFLLAACGGGGGGESAVSLSYGTNNLTATAFENQDMEMTAWEDATTSVMVTLSKAIEGNVYIGVEDTGVGFQGTTLEVVAHTATRFEGMLKPNTALEAGVYTGGLRVLLCRDVSCNSRYDVENDTLPYTVTITPQLKAEIYVNGQLVGNVVNGGSFLPVSAEGGSQMEIKTNIPAEVRYSSGGFPFAQVTVDDGSTATDWNGTVALAADTPQGGGSELQMLILAKDGTRQRGTGVDLSIPPAAH